MLKYGSVMLMLLGTLGACKSIQKDSRAELRQEVGSENAVQLMDLSAREYYVSQPGICAEMAGILGIDADDLLPEENCVTRIRFQSDRVAVPLCRSNPY